MRLEVKERNMKKHEHNKIHVDREREKIHKHYSQLRKKNKKKLIPFNIWIFIDGKSNLKTLLKVLATRS